MKGVTETGVKKCVWCVCVVCRREGESEKVKQNIEAI
jgi:hypothetical protein